LTHNVYTVTVTVAAPQGSGGLITSSGGQIISHPTTTTTVPIATLPVVFVPPIPVVPISISGCDNRTTGFSITTGQSCTGNIATVTTMTLYNFGTATLQLWSRGDAVKELQRFLNDKLNLGLVIDGILGPKTIIVIKKWQKNNGLVADGLVGVKTKAKMKEMSK
jgi:hypothetical protein